MLLDSNAFRYQPGAQLADFPTAVEKPANVAEMLADNVRRLGKLQQVLFADGRHAALFVFQGMDCAGKDSTIKHVLSGVNPQGVTVSNFRAPTHDEVAHSYLWRYWRAMPRRGMIGIFNRSHYEEVVVMRVHPEYFEQRHMPHPELTDGFWDARCDDMAALESHLTGNGIHVAKFYLHLSKPEQRKRLLGRIDRPAKNWKFDPQDLTERARWAEYMSAYQQAITRTHTEQCPWYIVPADDKPTMRALVAQIICERLEALPIAIPEPTAEQREALSAARKQLMDEA